MSVKLGRIDGGLSACGRKMVRATSGIGRSHCSKLVLLAERSDRLGILESIGQRVIGIGTSARGGRGNGISIGNSVWAMTRRSAVRRGASSRGGVAVGCMRGLRVGGSRLRPLEL